MNSVVKLMSRLTNMFDKVVNEKLINKTTVGNTTLGFDDKGTLSAKGKIGSTDVSVDSNGNAQATGKIAGGTMSTALNKDGDGGSAFSKDGKTVSHTAGSNDAWVSAGPNQTSKRVTLNNNKEFMEDENVQYDAHGLATVHKDGKFYLIFNDEVVGTYDTTEELKAAHEHVINKIAPPQDTGRPRYSTDTDENGKDVLRADGEVIGTYDSEPELTAGAKEHMNSFNEDINEDNMQNWKIFINTEVWDVIPASSEEEAWNIFFAGVKKEGVELFISRLVDIEKTTDISKTTSETTLQYNEDLTAMLRIAGLR